jgi:hypothetical protein
MPADTYALIGHGAWHTKTDRGKLMFAVPAGVYIIFWVRHGQTLINAPDLAGLTESPNRGEADWAQDSNGKDWFKPRGYKPIALGDAPIGYHRGIASRKPSAYQDSDKGPLGNDLPEVRRPGAACRNYRLTYEFVDALLAAIRMTRRVFDERVIRPEPDPSHVPPGECGLLLEDIVKELRHNHPRPTKDIHIHWAACRAHLAI